MRHAAWEHGHRRFVNTCCKLPGSRYNGNPEERITGSSETSIRINLHGVTSQHPVFFPRMTQIPVWRSTAQEVRTWQTTECGQFITTAAHHGASQQQGLGPHRADLTVQGRGRSATAERRYECAPLNRRSRRNSYTPPQQAARYTAAHMKRPSSYPVISYHYGFLVTFFRPCLQNLG